MEQIDTLLMQVFDLIEIADHNMCIIVTDQILDAPGPHILYVNKRWQEVTGYTSEEVVGKTPRILQGELSNREALNNLKETLKNGGKFEGSTVNYRKDGSHYLMSWIIVAALNTRYFVALQKMVVDGNELAQLKTIKDIQLNILKKLNEILPMSF